jgi:hypothetical protein
MRSKTLSYIREGNDLFQRTGATGATPLIHALLWDERPIRINANGGTRFFRDPLSHLETEARSVEAGPDAERIEFQKKRISKILTGFHISRDRQIETKRFALQRGEKKPETRRLGQPREPRVHIYGSRD